LLSLNEKLGWNMKILAIALLVLVLAFRAVAADLPADFVDQAKATLTRNFNDPDSAKYRDLYIGADKDGSPVLCGEVNARNGNGGMSGFQAFFSKPGADAHWAGVPREFLTIPNAHTDYKLREGDKCQKPGKPLP
jgi:hypothetical protein